jgi:hypothetical protein
MQGGKKQIYCYYQIYLFHFLKLFPVIARASRNEAAEAIKKKSAILILNFTDWIIPGYFSEDGFDDFIYYFIKIHLFYSARSQHYVYKLPYQCITSIVSQCYSCHKFKIMIIFLRKDNIFFGKIQHVKVFAEQ